MLTKILIKSKKRLLFPLFCVLSMIGIVLLTMYIIHILFTDVSISNESDSTHVHSNEITKPIYDSDTRKSHRKNKSLIEIIKRANAAIERSQDSSEDEKDFPNRENQQKTNAPSYYAGSGRSPKYSQEVSKRQAFNYSSSTNNPAKQSDTNTHDQSRTSNAIAYLDDSKKNYKNRNIIKAEDLARLHPELFEDEKAKEKKTAPEVVPEERLGPFEYSIYDFKAGFPLEQYSESEKARIIERIARPPDVVITRNALDSNSDKHISKMQALGYNGELIIMTENGFILNGEGPDFYLHSPVLEESFGNEAEVYVIDKHGARVSLGMIVTGTTGRAPFDLSVAGLSHTQMIVIQDAYPLMTMTEEEKVVFAEFKEHFPGFDIDSIELVNAIKFNQNKKEI